MTRHITHEENGLNVVARQRSGRDTVDEAFINAALARAIAKQLGIVNFGDLPNRVWAGITTVTPLIQQVVHIEGEWPFTLPQGETDEALCAFHDAVLDAPPQYLTTLQAAVKAADASPVPNVNGLPSDSKPNDVSAPELIETT